MQKKSKIKIAEKNAIPNQEPGKITSGKELKILYVKSKKWFKNYQTIDQFIEPCGFLIRNKEIEFVEDLSGDAWKGKNSAGRDVRIELDRNMAQTCAYGNRRFKAYLVDVERGILIPEDGFKFGELVEASIDALLLNSDKYKARLKDQAAGINSIIWTVVLALIVAGFAWFFFFKPHAGTTIDPATAASNAANTATVVANNITNNVTNIIFK